MGARMQLDELSAITRIIGDYTGVKRCKIVVGTKLHEDLGLDVPMQTLALSQLIENELSYGLDPDPRLNLLKIVTVGDLIAHLCKVI